MDNKIHGRALDETFVGFRASTLRVGHFASGCVVSPRVLREIRRKEVSERLVLETMVGESASSSSIYAPPFILKAFVRFKALLFRVWPRITSRQDASCRSFERAYTLRRTFLENSISQILYDFETVLRVYIPDLAHMMAVSLKIDKTINLELFLQEVLLYSIFRPLLPYPFLEV